MKQTPRRAEREIAKILSEAFVEAGYKKVERIPVLGRTGPDIEINDFKLVVDVKSRKSIPKCFLVDTPKTTDDYVLIPLDALDTDCFPPKINIQSKTIDKFIDHMDEWREENCPDGITALIVRRPGMPFGKSVLIIYRIDLLEYVKRWKMKTASQLAKPQETYTYPTH